MGGLIVICNIINVCNLINNVSGTLNISNVDNVYTIKRFFIYHALVYVVILVILVYHVLYLHTVGSHNLLGIHTNNYVYLYPIIIIIDSVVISFIITLYCLTIISYFQFTNCYNNIEVIDLTSTPL